MEDKEKEKDLKELKSSRTDYSTSLRKKKYDEFILKSRHGSNDQKY